jgi:hypothetical protein
MFYPRAEKDGDNFIVYNGKVSGVLTYDDRYSLITYPVFGQTLSLEEFKKSFDVEFYVHGNLNVIFQTGGLQKENNSY